MSPRGIAPDVFEPRPGEQHVEHPWYEQMLPGSLRLRLILPFVILIAIVLLVLAIFIGIRARDTYVNRMELELGLQAQTIVAVAESASPQGAGVDLNAVVDQLPPLSDRRVTLIAQDGTVLADTAVADPAALENHNSREEVREARTRGTGIAQRSSESTGVTYLYVATRVDDASGRVLRIAVPLTDVEAVTDRLRRYVLVAALVALGLAAAIATFIGFRLAEPLIELRTLAQRVARGDLDGEASPSAITEFDEVGNAFNMMTDALKRSLADLDKARTRLEAVLAGLEDGVVLTDIDADVLRVNRSAARMLAAPEARAVGRPFIQVARDHELADQLRQTLSGTTTQPQEVEYGLRRRVLQATATTVTGKAERLGLVVLRDVTDLRRLEGIRRDFVANVSHELRTPLTSIRALVETLEAGAVDDPEMTQEFFQRIIQEVDRLNALVEDLMDLARLESGRGTMRFEEVATAELLRAAGERLREQVDRARLELAYELPDGLPPVLVERRRIEQVVLNLVHNAIKFTPRDGTITIAARRDDDRVTVEVRDTGVGIPEDEADRLFERFYKSDKARRSEGSGLGLAIAKHIVQAHRGEIGVTSTPGKGSVFTFTLLVATSQEATLLRDPAGPAAPV
jgi:two-component system phosphate regulon sensor histidine kinase PhoR